MAPDWDKNTLRQELSGAVMASRLAVRVVNAMIVKPERVWVMGDNETVLACKEKHFAEWFSNRIGKTHDDMKRVKEMSPVSEDGEWWYISGADNPADRPTRVDSEPCDINYGRRPREINSQKCQDHSCQEEKSRSNLK